MVSHTHTHIRMHARIHMHLQYTSLEIGSSLLCSQARTYTVVQANNILPSSARGSL